MLKVVIEEERCKGCALCVDACPAHLIALGSRFNCHGAIPAIIAECDQARCTSCAMCARMCPDAAISIYRELKALQDADSRQ